MEKEKTQTKSFFFKHLKFNLEFQIKNIFAEFCGVNFNANAVKIGLYYCNHHCIKPCFFRLNLLQKWGELQ